VARKQPVTPPECDACGFVDPVGGVAEYPRMGGGMKGLCQLCANTVAGLTLDSNSTSTDGPVLQTVCYVANQIRRDIAGR